MLTEYAVDLCRRRVMMPAASQITTLNKWRYHDTPRRLVSPWRRDDYCLATSADGIEHGLISTAYCDMALNRHVNSITPRRTHFGRLYATANRAKLIRLPPLSRHIMA